MADDIDVVVEHLRGATRVLVISGAGMSADSGLPTYRGVGGLYNRETTEEGYPIEAALSGMMLREQPEICWKYIREIEAACRGATFNRGHQVIAEMEDHIDTVWVLTQNVDGFHQRAGSTRVIDIHGSIHDLICTACTFRRDVDGFDDLDPVPRCKCGAVLRPDVVLFGELLPHEKIALLEEQLQRGFDLVFSIGTTSVFPYIARPVVEARRRGTPTVEINPGKTEVSHIVDIKLPLGAAQACDRIWKLVLHHE